MNNKTANLLTTLIQRGIGYSIFNNSLLDGLEKIDSRISKRIRRKFRPKTLQKSKYSENEYFDTVIKNLARQILIGDEIKNEIQKIDDTPDKDTKIILKDLRKIFAIQERKK